MEDGKGEFKLVTYWQVRMSSYTNTAPKALSPRELGQIKALFRKTGMISRWMMDFAFQYWDVFTAEVISSTGFVACPPHPHIGYLLAHRDVAISLMVELGIVEQEDAALALEAVKYIDGVTAYGK
jgi:hypothetical protein